MDDKEQFTSLVAKHAPDSPKSSWPGMMPVPQYGECVSPSYEVFRGIKIPPHPDEFLELAISLNAIHPDEYLTGYASKEALWGDRCSGWWRLTRLNNATPGFIFPIPAFHAAAVSEPAGARCPALLAMLPGELVMRPLEFATPAGYEFRTDPVAGGLSQLHVLIPKVPCPDPERASQGFALIWRSVQILQPITFVFFLFSPVRFPGIRVPAGQ